MPVGSGMQTKAQSWLLTPCELWGRTSRHLLREGSQRHHRRGDWMPHGIPSQMQKNWGNLYLHSLCDFTCSVPVEAANGPVTWSKVPSRVRATTTQEWSWYSITHKVGTVRPSQVKETKALQGKEMIKAFFAGSLDHSFTDVPKRDTVKKEHRWRGWIPLKSL